MSKTAIEVITSVQRRRRWPAEEKERLVAASLEPGSGVSAVARQAGIHPSDCMDGDGSFAHVRSR
jgi:transposase